MRKKFIYVLWALVVGVLLVIALIFTAIAKGWIGYVPPIEELENPNLKFATEIISDDGKMLGTWSLSKENRVFVGYDQLSSNLIRALIATEDERFAEHSGIDARAFVRALVKRGVMMQKNAGGGSTITQQLAKQFYSPTADNVMERLLQKPIEWVIAVQLERYYTKEEILMKVAEINNLQDQINPHFLYNTLEVIRGEALINGDKKVAEMTEALANYFRYNISRKETFVYLKDELKNICNYFKIQQHRFGDRISFEIVYHGIEGKEVQNCYIPKLILQPIVENSIYHGLEMKIGGGVIKIHISSADDKLMLTIADDGLGMTQEDLDKLNRDVDAGKTDENAAGSHNGVALQNIKRRLKLYWGKEAYMIATSTLNYGTEMHLMLPLLFTKEDYMKS